MKKILITTLLVGLVLIGISQEVKKYDYVSMTFSPYGLYVSTSGGEYTFTDYKKERQGNYDWSIILKEVVKYENEGWEVTVNEYTGGECFFLLRRTRE